MKCTTCEKEVDPKWTHAIEMNICPYCGSNIMAEHLKNLLTSLRTTMEELQNYPKQLEDYLLSNFNFIKTDSPHLPGYCPKTNVNFNSPPLSPPKGEKSVVKVKTDTGEEEVEVQKLQSDEETSKFFKRADATKISTKTEHLKNLVQQIKKGTGPDDGTIAPDLSQADPEMIEQMENAIVSEGSPQISSALAVDGDDDIPAAVLAMAGNPKTGKNAGDILKLQNLYGKIDQSRKNFESGANRGKGGFSRSS